MKKQILFLAMFTLALIFAGTIESYGQYIKNLTGAPACVVPTPLACSINDDALHPLPGKNYTYTITTNPANVAAVHWYVTDVAGVINYTSGAPVLTLAADRDPNGGTGDYVLNATAAAYDAPANTSKTIDISWKSFDGAAKQVLLVAYVTGAAGCADNVEVYRIEPTFGFTLDIAGLLDAGGLGNEECVSPVESAQYNGTQLTMNYGENWVFFTVNAANFVHSWMPAFQANIANATSTLSAVEWAYPADAQADVNWHPVTDAVMASAAAVGGAVGPAGECIVLRVQADHGNVNELDADVAAAVITVGVNGTMYDPASAGYGLATNKDLGDGGAGNACTRVDFDDTANYTLTPRPALTDVTPVVAPGFEPKN